ncbi:MAG: hypothetical protein WCO63_15255 [Bacteroidota bacterium]
MNPTLYPPKKRETYESLAIHIRPEIIYRIRHDGNLSDAIRGILKINPRTMFTKLKENHIDLTALSVLDLICKRYDLELNEVIIQKP